MSFNRTSNHTERLIDFLLEQVEAGVKRIPYEDLNAAAGCDVQNGGYTYLATARRRLRDDHGHVWECERNFGLYLMSNGERARVHKRVATSVRRKVSTGKKVMNTADVTALSKEELDAYNIGQTRLLLIGAAASRATERRIEKAVEEDPALDGPFTLASAIDFLKKARKTHPPEVVPERDKKEHKPHSVE